MWFPPSWLTWNSSPDVGEIIPCSVQDQDNKQCTHACFILSSLKIIPKIYRFTADKQKPSCFQQDGVGFQCQSSAFISAISLYVTSSVLHTTLGLHSSTLRQGQSSEHWLPQGALLDLPSVSVLAPLSAPSCVPSSWCCCQLELLCLSLDSLLCICIFY